MLNFLPVLLILLTIVSLYVLWSLKVPLGTTWLIVAFLSLLDWGALLFLRFHLPQPVTFNNWFPLAIGKDPLSLGIDSANWLLMFALVSLMVGILFASAAHLQDQNIFATWVQTLSLAAIGLLVLLAHSVLAFVIFWALLDLVEILIFILINSEAVVGIQTYAIFIGRLLGLGLVILAMTLPTGTPAPTDLTMVSGTQLTLMIVGASLRLGVLPIHLPYTRDLLKRRSLSTLLRVLAPLSAFSFLSMLAAPDAISGVNLLILLLAVISCLFGAVNWLRAQNELEGRPYWILAFSGLALMSYFHGQPGSVLAWGVLMTILGGWAFLSETHPRKMDFLLPVVLLTISSLPFTPAAAGLPGIASGPIFLLNPILWVSLAILMVGLVKFSFVGGDEQHPYESWMRLFFAIGMSLMVASAWSILLDQSLGWNRVSYWWAALAIIIIFGVVELFTYVKGLREKYLNSPVYQFIQPLAPLGRGINQFFHFDWLYRLIGFLFSIQKAIVDGFNLIFEGESGILWALVFLVLLASLLVKGKGGS
jgi:hypothetical protein